MLRLDTSRCIIVAMLCASFAAACSSDSESPNVPGNSLRGAVRPELAKIQHIVIIMQENRSFDHYFGTFPGANGIPMTNGMPTVCVNDPVSNVCVKPFHDARDKNNGGPHGQSNASADIDAGKMDGFIEQAEKSQKGCADPNDPACSGGMLVDVMGYHDEREIPNYWAYARNFVLQDAMFEANASWSLPQHLFMVSEWSAHCTTIDVASSCTNALQNPSSARGSRARTPGPTSPICSTRLA